jgi:hypothetical protein
MDSQQLKACHSAALVSLSLAQVYIKGGTQQEMSAITQILDAFWQLAQAIAPSADIAAVIFICLVMAVVVAVLENI